MIDFTRRAAAGYPPRHISLIRTGDTPPPRPDIDADCYTRAEPARVFDLQGQLGEGGAYHRAHGIYLDPVSPKLPTLPGGWEQRLIRLVRGDLVAAFLDPNDAAVSKKKSRRRLWRF